jgi:MFS family permease
MGLTLSMYVLYLHNVRHFSVAFATSLLAMGAVLGMLTAPLWGTATDRFGPFRSAFSAYAANAVSLAGWAFVNTRLEAVVGAALLAMLGGAGWGPNATMMVRLVPVEHRARAFGVNFIMVNLGIGLGGLVSALIIDLRHPATFTALYLTNAGLSVATAFVYLSLRREGRYEPADHEKHRVASEGWNVIIRDRALLRYLVAMMTLMVGGYASQEAGLSLFVVNQIHISVHAIGIFFVFNTVAIVVAQLGAVNFVQGRSRTRVLALVGVMWSVFWLILAASAHASKFLAIVGICGAMIVFALGETLLQPASSSLINDLAPEHLRGRYNAASGLTWGVSGTIAPLVTALYFDHGIGGWWPLGTALTALLASALMLNLRQFVRPGVDRPTLDPAS